MLKAGQKILGDLTVKQVLSWEGVSGRSEVYLVQEDFSDKLFVAKRPQKRHGFDWGSSSNMQTEGMLTKVCQDIAGIPKLHGLWLCHTTKRLYIVQEYIEGVTFSDAIYNQKPEITNLTSWWHQIAITLRMMAERDIFHTDLTIDNLMIEKDTDNIFFTDLDALRMKGLGVRPEKMPRNMIPQHITWNMEKQRFN